MALSSLFNQANIERDTLALLRTTFNEALNAYSDGRFTDCENAARYILRIRPCTMWHRMQACILLAYIKRGHDIERRYIDYAQRSWNLVRRQCPISNVDIDHNLSTSQEVINLLDKTFKMRQEIAALSESRRHANRFIVSLTGRASQEDWEASTVVGDEVEHPVVTERLRAVHNILPEGSPASVGCEANLTMFYLVIVVIAIVFFFEQG